MKTGPYATINVTADPVWILRIQRIQSRNNLMKLGEIASTFGQLLFSID